MTITYQYRHLGKPNPVHRATEPATAPIGQEAPENAAPKHTPTPWRVEGPMALRVVADDPKGAMPIADIRGWGHLTGKGHGALGLSDTDAIAIQDANAAFIVKAVNAHHTLWDRIRKVEHDNEEAAARIHQLEAELAECRARLQTETGK